MQVKNNKRHKTNIFLWISQVFCLNKQIKRIGEILKTGSLPSLNYLVIVHISSQYLYHTDFIVFIGKHNSFVYNLLVTSILYDFF